MIKFFANKKLKIYRREIVASGAGDEVSWQEKTVIRAFLEPADGEHMAGSIFGDRDKISLIIYTEQVIHNGDRIYIYDEEKGFGSWFEIRHREFYRMPFFNYFKGYLVKTDENISI